jgi:hypothetical protein
MTRTVRNSTGWRTRSGLLAAVGAALAVGSIPAGAAVGPDLGAARSFAALGGSTLTNTGATTTIVGDVGVSPGSAVTGLTPAQVNGGIYIGGTTKADQAHSDAQLAYNFLAGMASDTNLTSTDLGGLTLSPGVYTFNSSAALTGAMFLDAGGDSGAVFVFQVGTSFTTASGSSVTVINGGADYDESKIFWQCGSSATLGTTTAFLGIIVADQSVTLETGATLNGIALAINGATSLDSNAVTSPTIITGPPPVTAPPINLTAVLSGTPVVPASDLEWNDASDNETEFRLYRRDGAGPAFVLIATIPSTTTAATGALLAYHDPVLVASTTYTYRVTAFGAALGESAPSNDALVDTGVVVAAILAPVNLTAVLNGAVGSEGADLSWNDASDNETEFRVYRRDGVGPDFVQVGTVLSTDIPGIVATVAFLDPMLSPSGIYTYRVTAFNAVDGESLPSNEAIVETAVVIPPPVRFLDLDLGRRRNVIRDRNQAHQDSVRIKGSFSVIDVDTGTPTVMDDIDPRTDGVAIQVRAPGNVVLLTIPANDPNWKANKRGVYRWQTHDGGRSPLTSFRLDSRKSEFTLKSRRAEFGSVPVNSITVTFTAAGATGSDSRTWEKPARLKNGFKALFTLPK